MPSFRVRVVMVVVFTWPCGLVMMGGGRGGGGGRSRQADMVTEGSCWMRHLSRGINEPCGNFAETKVETRKG